MVDRDGDGDAAVAGENFEEVESRGVKFDSFRSKAPDGLTWKFDSDMAVPTRDESAGRAEGRAERRD